MKSFKQFLGKMFGKKAEKPAYEPVSDKPAPAYPAYEGKDNVGFYHHHMHHTLGYPEHAHILKTLHADKTMGQKELLALHDKSTSYKIARSSSRGHLMKQFEARHNNLRTMKAKQDATAGRSAA